MKRFSIFLLFLMLGMLSASDQDSAEASAKAAAAEKAGDFVKAEAGFLEADVLADDPVLKTNALRSAARCCRKDKRYGAEFNCLQKLVKGHLARIDFPETVKRQYEIGDLYYAGHRDPVFTWLRFLKDESRMAEIYEAALQNAPCTEHSPEVRLRLARYYVEEMEQPDRAVKHLTELIKLHPDSKEAVAGALAMANILLQQSERGDGDGKIARAALEAFDDFLKKHPDAPEAGWVKRSRETVRTRLARRSRELGDFYRKKNKPEIAQRYYAEVLREYPGTEETTRAERALAELDKTYRVSGKKWTPEQRKFKYMSLPEEDSPIRTLPSDSGGRWLLPVRDVKGGIAEPAKEKVEVVDEEML